MGMEEFFPFRTDFYHLEQTFFCLEQTFFILKRLFSESFFFPNGPYYFLKFKEYFLNQQLHTLV